MPTEPVHVLLLSIETALLLGGVALFVALMAGTSRRHWLTVNRLPAWPITLPEFFLFAFMMFASGVVLQVILQLALATTLANAADSAGLQVAVYGAGFSGGGIIGWALFQITRKKLYTNYGATAPENAALATSTKLPPLKRLGFGLATFAIALPFVVVTSMGWNLVLERAGLPADPQPLVEIFAATQSSLVLAGMLIVACVLAPVSEELLFRGGVFRYLRFKGGRTVALCVSSIIFGAIHGNWSGLVPLSVLGAILAIAYEATGDIRVPIIAHALFNLNTVILVLSGVPELVQ